jgi:hypothetical protein
MQQTGTTAPALWIGGAANFTFDRTGYLSTNGPYAQVLYTGSSQPNSDIMLEEHVETIPTLFAAILLSGVSNPTVTGLKILDVFAESSFAQVIPDYLNGVTTAFLPMSDIRIEGVQGSVAATYTVYGRYSAFATATVSTGGSGCTNGAQTFTVSGGLGIAATITGTVSGNALSGALTIATGGHYATLPSSPATLTGGGCSVAPTATFTTSITGAPITVGGNLHVVDAAYFESPSTLPFSLLLQMGNGSSESTRIVGTEIYAPNTIQSVTGDHPLCSSTGGKFTRNFLGPFCGPQEAKTTASIGGGALLAGACASDTVGVASATTDMVATASPVTYPGDGFYWEAYVSSAGIVTVEVCSAVAGTPAASAYNVRVVP